MPIRAGFHILLVRVHHNRDELEDGKNTTKRLVSFSSRSYPLPDQFGTDLYVGEKKKKAKVELEKSLLSCPGATDTLAALGFLKVYSSIGDDGGG